LHHGDTENTEKNVSLSHDSSMSERVIKMAMDVHRQLGPGLLETIYEQCLCCELEQGGIAYARQVPLPVTYKTLRLDCAYRMDIVVDNSLVVEVKAVERILPIHEAQMLTYLRLSGHKVGLLMNFNNVVLKDGLRRFVL